MAATTATAQAVPRGVNSGNKFVTRTVVGTALANADTLAVTLPDGLPKDSVPSAPPTVYTLAGDVYTANVLLPMTAATHNRATGVTTYTATGAVAAGAIVIQEYFGVG